MAQIALQPTDEQVQQLLSAPDDRPVVMVNLLRFKTEDGVPVGAAEYGVYAAKVIEYVGSKGGRLIWSGRLDSQLIGEGAEGFHVIALVEYPSRKDFAEMMTAPFYAEISVHRTEGLEGQWLLAATSA